MKIASGGEYLAPEIMVMNIFSEGRVLAVSGGNEAIGVHDTQYGDDDFE